MRFFRGRKPPIEVEREQGFEERIDAARQDAKRHVEEALREVEAYMSSPTMLPMVFPGNLIWVQEGSIQSDEMYAELLQLLNFRGLKEARV